MHAIYGWVAGPLTWLAFLLFFGGLLYRLVQLLTLVRRKEPFIFSYMSLKYGLRSILHWSLPFGTVNWRLHPVMTIVTFAFHLCLLAAPIFLMAHAILFKEAWGFGWASLPDGVADGMTVIVMAGIVFFLVRRIVRPEVRFVTSASDYVLLAIVAAPFVTGFIAYHQLFAYRWMLVAHIVSGQIMLVAIPFTRLVHMLFAPLTRAYMGSEFGGVRRAVDW